MFLSSMKMNFWAWPKHFVTKAVNLHEGRKKNTPDDGTQFQFVLVLEGGQDTVPWKSRKGFTEAWGKE